MQKPPPLLDPTRGLEQVRARLAETSLRHFIGQAWRYIDPAAFVPGWHVDAICEHLEAVTAGEIKRLLITVPPRAMKSLSVSVAWPAWTWMQEPKPGLGLAGPAINFLFSSYAAALSIRDSVKTRRLIGSPWYLRNWGARVRLSDDQAAKARFELLGGGSRLATSVDGHLTGEGGDVVVVDDPHNIKEAESDQVREGTCTWYAESMATRLNDPKRGAFVVIMQRSHHRDLASRLIEERYVHLNLPMEFEPDHRCSTVIGWADPRTAAGELLWPARFGPPEVADLKTRMGGYAYAAQCQQRPTPRGGGLFKPEWFAPVDAIPAEAVLVRFWDMAATDPRQAKSHDPDYCCGALVGVHNGIAYIADIKRTRQSPAGVERLIKSTAEADGLEVEVVIEQEPGSAGKTVIDHYQRQVLPGFTVRGEPPTGSKVHRAEPMAAAAEAGNVRYLRGPWNRDFLDEVSMFPLGTHDDQVDGATGAFNRAMAKARRQGGPHIWRA